MILKGFFRGPSWTKRSYSRRCSSPRPSASSVDKCVAVAVLRGPSRPFADKRTLQSPLPFSAALRVLRGQMCCRCRSSRPFADKRKLQSPLPFSAALRVLRGQRCCRCRSSRSFAALRGQKDVAVAVAVLRGPPCPPWTNVLPLPFFAVLRGPSRTKGRCSRRCRSPRPSVSSVDKCVAVAVLRGPSRPFADKRTLQSPLPFSAALRVLRGQMCCRCRSSRPFADKRKLQSPLPFSAALRVLRGQRCCRCRSSRSFAALRGQKEVAVAVAILRAPPCPPRTNVLPLPFFAVLRGPSRTKGSCSRRCRVLRGPSVLRPSRPFVDKCCSCRCRSPRPPRALRGQMSCRCRSPRPFVDRPNYDLANLSSENRQRALTI